MPEPNESGGQVTAPIHGFASGNPSDSTPEHTAKRDRTEGMLEQDWPQEKPFRRMLTRDIDTASERRPFTLRDLYYREKSLWDEISVIAKPGPGTGTRNAKMLLLLAKALVTLQKHGEANYALNEYFRKEEERR